MSKKSLTIKNRILIHMPREIVWDYTQDYSLRPVWDKSILKAEVIETRPHRVVRLKARGNTTITFVYKLDDRPNKTSLATREVISPLIESAGGSWVYEDMEGSTRWTQTNTIVFKKNLLTKIVLPLYKFVFHRQTKMAMRKAKKSIEAL